MTTATALAKPKIAFITEQIQIHDVANVRLNPIANGGFVIRGEHFRSTYNDVVLLLQGAVRDARCRAICASDLPHFHS